MFLCSSLQYLQFDSYFSMTYGDDYITTYITKLKQVFFLLVYSLQTDCLGNTVVTGYHRIIKEKQCLSSTLVFFIYLKQSLIPFN